MVGDSIFDRNFFRDAGFSIAVSEDREVWKYAKVHIKEIGELLTLNQ